MGLMHGHAEALKHEQYLILPEDVREGSPRVSEQHLPKNSVFTVPPSRPQGNGACMSAHGDCPCGWAWPELPH